MEIRPRVISVTPLENYRLLLTFDNHERRIFDVTPYIRGNWFGELQNPEVFKSVRIAGLSVEWPNGQDICPDCLYDDSMPQ